MLFNAGELTLIEYGNNEPVGFCRTEHVSPHLISVRIHEKKNENGEIIEVKKVIAYLLDLQVQSKQNIACLTLNRPSM